MVYFFGAGAAGPTSTMAGVDERTHRHRVLRPMTVADVCRAATRRLAALALAGALPAVVPLAPVQQAQFARRFAPLLVFHPAEQFFPCSPLADLDDGGRGRDVAGQSHLESIESRIRAYTALSQSAKLALATVFYNVQAADISERTVYVEYWLYYVDNVYELHGGLIPYRMADVHPHDLEHVSLTLERTGDEVEGGLDAGQYTIRTIEAGAHAYNVRDNRFTVPRTGRIDLPLHVLVEHGSHAMAPDVNGDDVFTPGIDSNGDAKFVWGIRDTGATWAWYRARYEDPRPKGLSVRLAADASDGDVTATYRLVPVDDLVSRLGPSPVGRPERRALYGHTYWLKSPFDDVRTDRLLRPRAGYDSRPPIGGDRAARTDRGAYVGYSTILSSFTTLVGARYDIAMRAGYLPDGLVDGGFLRTASGSTTVEANMFATYPIDAITKVLAGESVRGDSFGLRDPKTNWAAGAEFRLGQWRLRTLALDPNVSFWLDVRLLYVF
jgi:hypothetical protein